MSDYRIDISLRYNEMWRLDSKTLKERLWRFHRGQWKPTVFVRSFKMPDIGET